jgi:hypothetical protein
MNIRPSCVREYDQHMPALIRSADWLKAFFSAGERAEAENMNDSPGLRVRQIDNHHVIAIFTL